MKQAPCAELSAQDRRVLNVLEIKMYDLAQNVEIIGKQLTNNQIKDVLANTYNIFCQLRRIFENSAVTHLYEIVRKMQVNSVVLVSILTERIDKKSIDPVKPNPQQKIPPSTLKVQKVQSEQMQMKKTAPSKLGGINLYNQSYTRGLEYYEVTDAESLEQMAGKCRIKQSKKLRQQFLSTISREIELKAEVEMETVSDEIKKYIKDYKQNSKINSYISYEKQLIEIIDFFKVSELEAMSFLNKAPNSHDYTEDFINRMNDLENELKLKEKSQKKSINEKLKEFIMNLKEKIHQTEQRYLEKANKLALYEKSLKKDMNSLSTQTYDGYQSRLKEQEFIIKQLQERYKILSEIKNKQLSYESKYYDAYHELNVKVAEINKIKTVNTELQEQMQFLKKIIRQNKEKFHVDLRQLQKRRNKNKKMLKQQSKKELQEAVQSKGKSLAEQSPQIQRRASKMQKKTKRLERLGGSQNSTYFKSIQLSEIQKEINGEAFQESDGLIQTPKKTNISQPTTVNKQLEAKQSVFKNQYKKNSKKMSYQERKVSFIEQDINILGSPITQKSQSNEASLSIDNIKSDEVQYDNSPKSSRKNTLKQIIDSNNCSLRSLDQNKKSNKSISKKCIIMKDNTQKQKSILATAIKFENLSIITQIINLTIFPDENHTFPPTVKVYKSTNPSYLRKQRPSYPFMNTNTQQLSGTSLKSNQKLNQHIFQVMNKVKSTNINIYNNQKLKILDNSQKCSFIDKSKNENQSYIGSNSHINFSTSEAVSPKFQGINYKKLKKVQRPKAHVDKHRKDIAAYLDKINSKNRDASLSDNARESTYEKWRGNSIDNSQTNTITDYIIDQLTKQQLDIEEFQQIVQILQEEDRCGALAQNNSVKKIEKNIVPIFKEFQTKIIKKQGKTKQKSHAKRKQNKQAKEVKQVLKERNDDILGIGMHIYMKIRELHKDISKCKSIDNQPCEHLIKYLNIIKKVNEIGSHKSCLKMHIQRIGQVNQSSQSYKRSLQDLKCTERHFDQLKLNKSNYVRANLPTLDQPIEQQRERILPVISTATSTYYKPKSKVFNK